LLHSLATLFSKDAAHGKDQREHDQILAILLIFYGCFQLLGTVFFGIILWAVTGGNFYYHVLKTPLLLTAFGLLLLILFIPFLVAYGLLKRTEWARGAVLAMSIGGILLSFLLLILPSQLNWSTNFA
jgi:lysylphosphatidylglycerol synthetase-like protein (DUF2156 family)